MSELTAAGVKEAFAAFASPERATNQAWFFKTGPGEYGEGDRFIGATVPQSRLVAKQFAGLPEADIFELAQSPIHEHRHCALVILVNRFKRAKTQAQRDELFDLYMRLLDGGRVNNWDLIDISAPYLGDWWADKPDAAKGLAALAAHQDLWHRRAAIMFTFSLVRDGRFEHTLAIAEQLLGDEHDLIHKAVGWMLREVGNRDRKALEVFLQKFAPVMPRTMLRYAIEKLDEPSRKAWLAVPRHAAARARG